jgi:hypothetical protein
MSVEFNHIGLLTAEKQKNENYIDFNTLWVSNPGDNRFSVEWIRPDPGFPQKIDARLLPHVGFHVDSIEKESKGLRELREQKQVGNFVTCAFYDYDGFTIELQQYHEDEHHWYDGQRTFANNLAFDHISIFTTEKQKDEIFVESSDVWVSNPGDNRFSIQRVRPGADCRVDEVKRLLPRVVFRVNSIEAESRGLKEIAPPTVMGESMRCAFFDYHGIVLELRQYLIDE